MDFGQIIWSQKANSKTNSFKNFSFFVYEFIIARITILAFIALFNFSISSFRYFGYILAAGIAYFLYLFISDAYNIFWNGINLQYNITSKGIFYDWGVIKKQQLFIPIQDIEKAISIEDPNENRRSIVFENKKGYRNQDYGFSEEKYFHQLSFEKIDDLKLAISCLRDLGIDCESRNNYKVKEWTERIKRNTYYLKFLNFLAFTFLYLFAYISLQLIDNNLLKPNYVEDKIVAQKKIMKSPKEMYNILTTAKGYEIKIRDNYDYSDEEVAFYVGKLFNEYQKFESYKSSSEYYRNKYRGLNGSFKILAGIASLLSTCYIFYKKGDIDFEDLSIFLLCPLFLLFIAFYLFH